MSYRVVIDACALYPFNLRDALLRLAELEFYDVVWSERILDEMSRNLIKRRQMTEERATRTLRAMSTAFPDAAVSSEAVERLEPVMTSHPKDRHVLAAAVVGCAEAVITMNLRDFADENCAMWRVRAIHPDDFLLTLLVEDRTGTVACLRRQAGALVHPPVTCDELLSRLSLTVPRFVAAVRS